MNTNDTRKPSLDEVLNSIRTDESSALEIESAATRVSATLGLSAAVAGAPTHIDNCHGFQALIPAYLAGSLPSQTALLIEDHSRECIPCRRALIAARGPPRPFQPRPRAFARYAPPTRSGPPPRR